MLLVSAEYMDLSFHHLGHNLIHVISPDSTTAGHNITCSLIRKSWVVKSETYTNLLWLHLPLLPSRIHDRAGSHRPCAEAMSGLGCNRKEKENKESQGWGLKKRTQKLELELEEGTLAWGGDLWGTFITTQHCPGEVKEEGWGKRSKTFPFPFLFFGYTEATWGVEIFVSMRAAMEDVFLYRNIAFIWDGINKTQEKRLDFKVFP